MKNDNHKTRDKKKFTRLYTLEVFLLDGPITEEFAKENPELTRTIQILGNQTLEELHSIIFKAFDRYDEHLYEFQFGIGPHDPNGLYYVLTSQLTNKFTKRKIAGDVTNTKIDSLDLKDGQSFGYLFDFGDDWMHQIYVLSIDYTFPAENYPKIIKRIGDSPPQYPLIDEEDNDENWSKELHYFNLLQNQCNIADFEGLTPLEMYGLLYSPFDLEKSPLILNTEIDSKVISRSKIFSDVTKYLHLLEKYQPLKLTQKKNLPRKFCRELFEMDIINEDFKSWYEGHPIMKESDCMYIHLLNKFTHLISLTKIRKGTMTLTAKCENYLNKKSVVQLYHYLFAEFATKLNWAYGDLYPESWIIQEGFGFSLFLLMKYGDKQREFEFYADKFLCAFPNLMRDFPDTPYSTAQELYYRCYYRRVFQGFMELFGLVSIEGDYIRTNVPKIKKTDLIDKLISWNVGNNLN